MLFIDRLELNNKVWFRKLVRALGGELIPNFEVEELRMMCPRSENQDVYLIGESAGEYECVSISHGNVYFIDKWEIDQEYRLINVVYKNLKSCPVTCESRIKTMDKLKMVEVKFEVPRSEGNELLLDMFTQEVEQYLKCATVYTYGNDEAYTVRVKYLSSDEKKYNKIKDKYARKIYTINRRS